ncbi:MAG: hypothetical protein QXH24_06745 [Candidatus Bathyarchaeia archaeon]
MKIYISGLHSGPNPSPGVGIARSLRLGYPDATLIGVDYSNRSSGIHWPDFDEIWLQRPWNELDLEEYALQIRDVLDAGAFWISGLDLEIFWLAREIPRHPNLLIPPLEALKKVAKPIHIHQNLPFKTPPFIATSRPDWELHAFCRKYGWKVWLKGPYYEAYRVRSWTEFISAYSELSHRWSTDKLFLQAHVKGYEESIAFSAYNGTLLDCVYLSKRDITPEGKVWSGHISKVPEEIENSLSKIIKDLAWTGGGELEFIRDIEGNLWLIEWNPRFPAWIYGATIAGHNLPALLIEAATGIPANKIDAFSQEFTRVVLEIPVKSQFPLPYFPESALAYPGPFLKHPSGMPILAEKLKKLNGTSIAQSNSLLIIPSSIIDDLSNFDFNEVQTPCWVFLEKTAEITFEQTASLIKKLSSSSLRISIAYSIKTNPDERFLELAYKNGYEAEAINLLEVKKALSKGFTSNQIILNGPGKWWPFWKPIIYPFHAIFCDSLEELRQMFPKLKDVQLANIIGVRIRPPGIFSRFGISLESYENFNELIHLVKKLPSNYLFGIHFHIPSITIGIQNWLRLYESILKWCQTIESASGKRIECLDIGGGWFPDDWNIEFKPRLDSLVSMAQCTLPHISQFIMEPGRALAQPCMALATRVLEIRGSKHQNKEIVVDGSIAEVPLIHYYPHRILHFNSKEGRWELLRRGSGRILGRLCMEDDILAVNIEIPEDIKVGDILVICDVGAYDRSMSYVFGQG